MTRKLSTAAAIVATVSVLGGVSATAASAAPAPVSHSAFSRGGVVLSGQKVAPHAVRPRSRIHINGTGNSLPASVDLSQYDMPVADQGSVDDSCVSWAVDYAMFGWYANEMGESTAFAPMYSYSQIHVDNSAGGGGSSTDSVFFEAESQGVDTQSDYTQGNYNFTTAPTSSEIANAAHYKAVGYNELYSWNNGPGVAGVAPIETELASGNPVALTIADFDAFGMLNSTNYNLDASQVSWGSDYLGEHEVLAVGYDSTGVTIQNSWGTSWGDHGYAHLDWAFIEDYSAAAETISGLTITGAAAPTLSAITPNSNSTPVVTPPVVTPPVVTPPVVTPPVVTPPVVTPPVVTPPVVTPPAPAPGPVAPPAPITPPAPVTPPVVKPVPAPIKPVPAAAPLAPKATVTKTNTATIHWTAPASHGTAAITGYRVTGPTTVTVKGTTVTFAHLVHGRRYTIKIAAITSAGIGAATSVTIEG
jgi:hypothetical protein